MQAYGGHTDLHEAVVGGQVVPYRISPSLVVAFEEGKERADFFQDLSRWKDKIKSRKHASSPYGPCVPPPCA